MLRRVHGLEMELTPVCVYKDKVQIQDGKTDTLMWDFCTFLKKNLSLCDVELNRIVLPNQGQTYTDMGHLEICTPECTSFSDLVLHIRVSCAIIANELKKFNAQPPSCREETPVFEIYSIVSDVFATDRPAGCHENYQIERKKAGILKENNILTPFLIARKLLEGSGLFHTSKDKITKNQQADLFFYISQRLPFIERLYNDTTTSKRPIICTREEPLIKSSRGVPLFIRRQIFIGEHNLSPYCDFVKMASTSLLWEMLEEGYFESGELPFFKEISEESLVNFLAKVNKDLECRNTYELTDGRNFSLADVLLTYAGWMLDYLDNRYQGEKDNLYFEKLEVANKIIQAADCFKKGDIFALSRDIDWIIKLRWMQDFLIEAADIEIGDDEIQSWENLGQTLKERWGNSERRNGLTLNELIETVLWRHLNWHHLGPRTSFYRIWEECGLVNPLTINGKEINLKEEVLKNLDKAPMNPPNRSYTRWQILNFMKELGLEEFLVIGWSCCSLKENPSRRNKLNTLFNNADAEIISLRFPWNFKHSLGEDPALYDVSVLEEFKEVVQNAIGVKEKSK